MSVSTHADDALEPALRALRSRDRSVREIERELEARGIAAPDREAAIETLVRTGLVDDRRFAESRASALARRGAGDALVRHDLRRAGVADEIVDHALDQLETEHERARAIVERRGSSSRTARYLAGKGFSEDVVRAAIAEPEHEGLG